MLLIRLLPLSNLTIVVFAHMVGTADIMYEAPLVPLQEVIDLRFNGQFKLVHIIDLGKLELLIQEVFLIQREAALLTDPRIGALVTH